MALIDNLISYWKLDEASGQRNDSHGTNHLADNNTVTQAGGKLGNAAQFTRANQESLSIPDNASLSVGSTDFTFSLWVYADSFVAGFPSLLAKGGLDTEYAVFYNDTSKRFKGYVLTTGSGTVSISADSLGQPSTATWYFIIWWYDSASQTLNIQINNGAIDSIACNTNVIDGSEIFRLGWDGGQISWDGRIDAVSFWKRVLTPTERTSLYNEGAGLEYPFTWSALLLGRLQISSLTLMTDLVSHWSMDETSGSRADSFGSNNLSEAGSGSVGSDTGVLSNAAKFVAVNTSYLERVSNASLQTGNIDFTACCWVMLEGTLASSSQFPIISKWNQGDVTNCEWRIVFEAGDGLFEFQWSNGVVAGGVENGSFSAVAGTWFFLAAVHDATLGKINLYCNGIPDFWVSRSGGIVTAAPFRVGAQDGTPRYHNMKVDNIDFYKRMLSETEIIAMYNSGTPLAFPYA